MAALDSPHIGGVLFTGSLHAGLAIHRRFAGRPEILLALEMGGNNPLVIDRVADVRGAVETIIQSAFLTSGQRCTCARRLVLVDTDANRQLLDELGRTIPRIRVGDPFGNPAPYLGTLIDAAATQRVLHKQQTYIDGGMHARCRAEGIGSLGTQLTPGLLEDPKATADDEEVFGPLLVARWVPDLDAAIAMANATRFGLSASLLSDDEGAFRTFQREVRAGIVNWNHPTTGATGTLPFGGLGLSGNHRSSGYFAADYCSDPVASLRRPRVAQAELGPTGLEGLWTS
jgi:succinylglutamic semialdehyde dehydrogenase